MAVPCQVGPKESLTGIKKIFLSWVPINIKKDWKAKLESTYSFMLKYSKITVCTAIRFRFGGLTVLFQKEQDSPR